MPDVAKPTLFLVCDSHQCRLFDVGGHAVVEKETLQSKEPKFTDRQGTKPGKGGMMIGLGDTNPLEDNRLKEFANVLMKHVDQVIREQKIEAIYISAPSKFLSVLRDHHTASVKKVLKKEIDGNFVKEHPLELLARFRPDLAEAVKALRSQENYSPGNQLPKK